jgi:hypothetical protein
MVPPFFLLLAILAGMALLLKLALSKAHLEPATGQYRVPPEDFAVSIALVLFLPLMLVVTHFGTNYYQPRYGLGSAIGISMLSGLLWSCFERCWRHAASIAWAATIYSLFVGLLGLWLAAVSKGVLPWSDPMLHAGNQQEPIVIASALEFSPIWWYSDDQMRKRIHYLSDPSYAGQHSDLIPEYSLVLERAYTPMQLDNYQVFLKAHQRFLLYSYGEPRLEWIKQRLIQEGWHLKLLQSAALQPALKEDDGATYREMYQVTR